MWTSLFIMETVMMMVEIHPGMDVSPSNLC
jgi:hypothetical protein